MILRGPSPDPDNSVCPDFDLPAEQLRRNISGRYDVVERSVMVAGSSFTFLKVRDTNRLIDEISAAKAGGIVTLTDYEDDALCFARLNAAMNLPPDILATNITLRLLDWRSMEDPGTFDVVLASDVVYERRNFLPLLDVVGRALAPHGRALVTDPDRSTGKEFISLALTRGFSVASFSSPVDFDGRTSSIIRYELRRSAGQVQ